MDLINDIRASQRLAKWDLRPIDCALFVSMIFAFAFLVTNLLAKSYTAYTGLELDPESLTTMIISGFGLQLGSLLAWLLFRAMVSSESQNQPDSLVRSLKVGAIGFVAAYLVLIPSALLWKTLLDLLHIDYSLQLPVLLAQNGGTPTEMRLLTILICIAAPICEELVYRGVIFRYLNNRLPLWVAVTLSSVFFAAMHVNLYSLVPLFVLGSILCLAYRLTGSLVSCITIHLLFNSFNLALILFTEGAVP